MYHGTYSNKRRRKKLKQNFTSYMTGPLPMVKILMKIELWERLRLQFKENGIEYKTKGRQTE